jgi:hypothetical protein
MSSYKIGEIDFLGERFVDLRGPVKAMSYTTIFQSMNAFLNWFKLVAYLARYPVFALMTRTLEHAIEELSAFAVVFVIVMFGFAQAHSLFFGKQLENYETISSSFLTLFRAMLGDFNFAETYKLHYVIGPLFFITFVGIAFLVVLNIIIAIIADAYVDATMARKILLKKKKMKEEAVAKDLKEKKRLSLLAKSGIVQERSTPEKDASEAQHPATPELSPWKFPVQSGVKPSSIASTFRNSAPDFRPQDSELTQQRSLNGKWKVFPEGSSSPNSIDRGLSNEQRIRLDPVISTTQRGRTNDLADDDDDDDGSSAL